MRRCSLLRSVLLPQVLPLILISLTSGVSRAAAAPRFSIRKIEPILEDLKKQLGIDNSIRIQIVKTNRMGFSVEPRPGHSGEYLLSIDTHFLALLDDEELRAALAHELGHVWIYTHHPYLQTEARANQIAMQTVARSALERLYKELWAFDGTPGNIEQLLGAEHTAEVKLATGKQ